MKIIILDSIAFHFRHDFEDMGLRTRLLHGLVQTFMKLAYDFKLAVCINTVFMCVCINTDFMCETYKITKFC